MAHASARHSARSDMRTKLLPWLAGDRYSVQGHEHALARSQVRLQSVKENLLCGVNEGLGVIFRHEGRRARQ